MSFGNSQLDKAYDNWVTRSPYDDVPICKKCEEHHEQDEKCEEHKGDK